MSPYHIVYLLCGNEENSNIKYAELPLTCLEPGNYHILVAEFVVHFPVFVAMLHSVSSLEKNALSLGFSLSTQTHPPLGIAIRYVCFSDTNCHLLPLRLLTYLGKNIFI